jgi:hypothetical protein
MSDVGLVRSDRGGLDELFLAYGTGDAERGRLALDPGWPRRWTAEWRSAGGEVACTAGDLESVPLAGCKPVRRFAWSRRQQKASPYWAGSQNRCLHTFRGTPNYRSQSQFV